MSFIELKNDYGKGTVGQSQCNVLPELAFLTDVVDSNEQSLATAADHMKAFRSRHFRCFLRVDLVEDIKGHRLDLFGHLFCVLCFQFLEHDDLTNAYLLSFL